MKRQHAEASAPEKIYYTLRELRARYGNCAASTIYRKIPQDGYPRPQKFGRSNLFAVVAVHEWERTHMPLMHPPKPEDAEIEVLATDDANWTKFRRRLERQPPQKARRRRR